MIKANVLNWADFKNKVNSRGINPQFYEHVRNTPDKNIYKIFAVDQHIQFEWNIIKDVADPDYIDFRDNYESIWNQRLEYRDSFGLPRFHVSPRPDGEKTYFTSAGDNGGTGNGTMLLFNMAATDGSKVKDLSFNEEVFIKDGIIIFENAPLGCHITLEIVNPITNAVIDRYMNKLTMLGTGRIDVNSEDTSPAIPAGVILRITVTNSDGSGEQDPAAAFKVTGTLEMYRVTTI